MTLVGIVAKSREIKLIKKEFNENNIEIIPITKQSIQNLRNIKFDEIIFLQNINLEEDEYKYLNEIISNVKYLIINEDINIDVFDKMNLKSTIKLITFGFNSKSTITISSVNDEKILVCLQRNIEKENGEILENQEKQIIRKNCKNIYEELIVFIIKELYFL